MPSSSRFGLAAQVLARCAAYSSGLSPCCAMTSSECGGSWCVLVRRVVRRGRRVDVQPVVERRPGPTDAEHLPERPAVLCGVRPRPRARARAQVARLRRPSGPPRPAPPRMSRSCAWSAASSKISVELAGAGTASVFEAASSSAEPAGVVRHRDRASAALARLRARAAGLRRRVRAASSALRPSACPRGRRHTAQLPLGVEQQQRAARASCR